MAYGQKVYELGQRLGRVKDWRWKPKTTATEVAMAVFFSGLLRIRSFNALEPKLSEKPFLRLLGSSQHIKSLCSVDTVSRALRKMNLETVRCVSIEIVAKAERNKIFREGWYGALRYVAVDGWEPICSFNRHCAHCLVRLVKVKQRNGETIKRKQYYHRYAVAMMIDKRFDMALDLEPVLPKDLRSQPALDKDEGELTAAKRLIQRVKQTFGWLDVVVADSLYANGPFLSLVQKLRMGAVIIARKSNDEPLKEALYLWGDQPPEQRIEDKEAHERIELWDCPELRTLDSYDGPIRVVRGRVTDTKKPTTSAKTWCMLVVGKASKLPSQRVLAVGRGRWHIENTAFHQWTTCWKFDHVFVHDAAGILALFWLFFAAFNLLTLFLYRQLRCYGRDRGKDVTRTISRLIDEMQDDLRTLDFSLWDTS